MEIEFNQNKLFFVNHVIMSFYVYVNTYCNEKARNICVSLFHVQYFQAFKHEL